MKELCALHALNNLFQKGDAFLKNELDTICYSLAPKVWFNPHKSLLGLGNYDVNVVMAALQNKGYQVIWFDKRKYVFSCLKGTILIQLIRILTSICIINIHYNILFSLLASICNPLESLPFFF